MAGLPCTKLSPELVPALLAPLGVNVGHVDSPTTSQDPPFQIQHFYSAHLFRST